MTEGRRQNFSAPTKTSRKDAMNTAVRILTYLDHSKYELKRKLKQRGFAGELIDTVIIECERLNYIDDQRTARVYISQLKRKCFGKRHIRMALKKKRLSGAVIESRLETDGGALGLLERAARRAVQVVEPQGGLVRLRARRALDLERDAQGLFDEDLADLHAPIAVEQARHGAASA